MDGRLLHPAMASRSCFLIIAVVCAGARVAAESPVELPPIRSLRHELRSRSCWLVAMPVTALRYEPLLDVEARNQAEEQADMQSGEASSRIRAFASAGFRSTIPRPDTTSRSFPWRRR